MKKKKSKKLSWEAEQSEWGHCCWILLTLWSCSSTEIVFFLFCFFSHEVISKTCSSGRLLLVMSQRVDWPNRTFSQVWWHQPCESSFTVASLLSPSKPVQGSLAFDLAQRCNWAFLARRRPSSFRVWTNSCAEMLHLQKKKKKKRNKDSDLEKKSSVYKGYIFLLPLFWFIL